MQSVHPIVSVARTWIGTRFHHQGRVKANAQHKGGVDCLGLVVEIGRELGLKDKQEAALLHSYDETDYAWLPPGEALTTKLKTLLLEVPPEAIQEGDIGLFMLDNNPQHVAIFTKHFSGFNLIHAYAPSRKVVEVQYDDFWQKHLHAAFRCIL